MSSKTPVRATFSGSNVTGLAEYQSGEFIPLTHGGLGASLSIGSAGQVLKVNGAGNAIEFGAVEAIINIDGATDLTSATLQASDQIMLSDGGTEGRVTLSQIDTLFKDTTQTLTNKTIALGSNTISGTTAQFNSALSDGSFATLAGTETLTNKTITNPTITGGTFSGTFTGTMDATGMVLSGASPLVFEGATDDAAETTLAFTDPTTDRTITFPNATGTIVLEATGSTLTNKSIDLGNNTISGSLAEFNTALQDDSFVGLAATQTLTNKTLTSAVLNTAVSGSAILDEDDLSSNSATQLATQQSIKAYVDAVNTSFTLAADSGSNDTFTSGNTLTFDGGTGIDTTVSDNQISIAIDSTVTTLTGTQTLTNKTLTTPVIEEIDGTTITLDSAGDINLDADGADIILKDGGTEFGRFTNSSTDFVIKSAVSDKDLIFKGNDGGSEVTALTLDMSSAGRAVFAAEVSVGTLTVRGGHVTLPGQLTVSDVLNASSGLTTDNLTIENGGNEIDVSSGDLTLDVAGDIILNADGGDWIYRDGSDEILKIYNSSSDVNIKAQVQDKDILFQGNDGGTGITALTLDMSDAGAATFNSNVTVGGNAVITGNLTVNGSTTTLSTTNSTIEDRLIELGTGTTGTPGNDMGLVFERGDSDNAFVGWDESADKFIVGTGSFTGASTGNLTITTGTLVANIEGNVTGNVTGDVTGNADTATALATARNIGGVSFDGSANINLPGVNTSGNQDTSGNAATATALETARTIAGQSFDGTGNITIASTDLSNTSAIALLTSTQTLTNKTIDLGDNTLTGTTAEFNSALQDGSFATLAGTETLTNKTITSPSVSGLALSDSSIVFEGATANNFETTLTVVDPTADRTITLQNGSGTLAFLSDVTGGATPGNFTTITLDNNITFEGDTDDAHETTLTVEDPTADRTVTIPNATGQIVLRDTTDTLTNKTIALGSNTVSGTTAQFNSALTDGSFATLAGTETLTNKTLTSPVIAAITSTADIDLTATNDVNIPADVGLTFGDDGEKIEGDGTDLTISTSNDITIDAARDIILDGDQSVKFMDGGVLYASISLNSGISFTSQINNGDIFFRGNDGGSFITALTLDMSDAGSATFNNNVAIGGNATITGNLTVNGTTTTLATTNSVISDRLIELGNGTTGTPGNDMGIVLERGDSDNAFIGWDESADKFIVGTGSFTGASTGNLTITTGTLVANLEGNVTGNVTGDVTGNADTATALATARTIAGQSFDGSANITIASTDLSNTSAIALLTSTQTLTNKTIDLGDNTLTGTTAEFNSALQDGSFATLAGTETLTNKTLTTPTIEEIDGSTITLDSAGDIILDADGADVLLKDGGTTFGSLRKDGNGQLEIQSGSGPTTVINFDSAQKATFAGDIAVGDDIFLHTDASVIKFGLNQDVTLTHVHDTGLLLNANMQLQFGDAGENISGDGTNLTIASSNNLILDAANDVNIDADSGNIYLKDAGTEFGLIAKDGSNNLVVKSSISDADFILKGNDGGSTVNALTLDMSAAGAATFNSTVTASGFVGDVTGDVTGNADTATTLATARTIAGQSFDGSANITIASTDLSNTSNITLNDATQTLTNKTLTSPTINAFSGTGNASIAGTLSLTSTSTGDVLNITTTENSATAGPTINLKRNSSSIADADYMGRVKFTGENDADQEITYAKITGKIQDASDGSEDGLIEFANIKAGTQTITARLRSDSFQLLNDTNLSVAGDATITGDLTVNGTTTTVSTTNTVVSDSLLELGNGTSGTPSNDAGIVIERGSADNAFIGYDESDDKFKVGTGSFTGSSTGNLTVTTGTLVANIEGNVTGNVTGNVSGSAGSATGNAATATALETARTIGGVSFDGTANINLPGVNTSGTQDTTGNAATATALETARNIAGQSFDGTGNISIASTDLSDTASIALLTSSQTLTNKTIDSDNNTITNIVNADIKSSAAIAFSKMADLTASRALVSDSNGDVSVSDVTSTEIGYLDGVSSAIQTQLDNKSTKGFAIAMAIAL